jgi:hypothetical protein
VELLKIGNPLTDGHRQRQKSVFAETLHISSSQHDENVFHHPSTLVEHAKMPADGKHDGKPKKQKNQQCHKTV